MTIPSDEFEQHFSECSNKKETSSRGSSIFSEISYPEYSFEFDFRSEISRIFG